MKTFVVTAGLILASVSSAHATSAGQDEGRPHFGTNPDVVCSSANTKVKIFVDEPLYFYNRQVNAKFTVETKSNGATTVSTASAVLRFNYNESFGEHRVANSLKREQNKVQFKFTSDTTDLANSGFIRITAMGGGKIPLVNCRGALLAND
jgi:hypothetical protein